MGVYCGEIHSVRLQKGAMPTLNLLQRYKMKQLTDIQQDSLNTYRTSDFNLDTIKVVIDAKSSPQNLPCTVFAHYSRTPFHT